MNTSKAATHAGEGRGRPSAVAIRSRVPVTVKLATTQSELEQSYRLLHDVYVLSGFMKPHRSGMRISIYNALPGTRTFVAKENGIVIGCISSIPDSPFGLPMDQIYKQEVDALRRRGRRLVEVSGLATAPEYSRKGARIFLSLVQNLTAQAHVDGMDDFCIAINPSHKGFYEKGLHFEVFGGLKSYDSVNSAPAYALRLRVKDYMDNCRAESSRVYKNLGEDLEKLLKNTRSPLAPPVMSEKMIQYFFCKKTDLFCHAPLAVYNFVKDAYPSYDIGKVPTGSHIGNELFFRDFAPMPLSG